VIRRGRPSGYTPRLQQVLETCLKRAFVGSPLGLLAFRSHNVCPVPVDVFLDRKSGCDSDRKQLGCTKFLGNLLAAVDFTTTSLSITAFPSRSVDDLRDPIRTRYRRVRASIASR
jgi:hypothetical protein